MRFRQSMLKVWTVCPLQAKFKSIDHLPSRQNAKASFGTVIHHCLEAYNQGVNVEACVEMFKTYWAEPERLGVKPDYYPKYTSYGKLREAGVDVLRQYHNVNRWENRTVIASEHRFLVPFGEHELEGTVDHVELKKAGNGKQTLRVIDFKTNARQPYQATLRLDIQFTVYVYASLQPEFWMGNGPDFPGIPKGEEWYLRLKKVDRRAIWYHVMTNKEISAGDRDDGDFMRLYRLATEIERAIKADVYVPNISGESCVICDYNAECNITIPDRDEMIEQLV